MLIAAAGPVSNLLQAFVIAIVLRVLDASGTGPALLHGALGLAIEVNLWLAFFNLLPVPPLDGGNVALGLLPRRLAAQYDQVRQFGFIILYALMFSGIATRLIEPPTELFLRILLP